MDQLLYFLYQLLAPLEGVLKPLSMDNVIIFVLAGIILLLAATMVIAPTAAATLGIDTSKEDANVIERMARQARLLRAGDDRPLKERASRLLYRDGKKENAIVTDSEFFWFLRVVLAITTLAVIALIAVVSGVLLVLFIGIAAYNAPLVWASMRNNGRRRKINAAIPAAMRRIETRIAAGLEVREAFAKVSADRTGPLYSELAWSSGQMAIPGNDPFDILRDLDVRNDILFFAPLADQVERASRRGHKDGTEAFLKYIDKVLEDDENQRQVRIASLGNKVIMGMAPFLVFGLLISIMAPFATIFLEGGGFLAVT